MSFGGVFEDGDNVAAAQYDFSTVSLQSHLIISFFACFVALQYLCDMHNVSPLCL